jgi:hypothetical protein
VGPRRGVPRPGRQRARALRAPFGLGSNGALASVFGLAREKERQRVLPSRTGAPASVRPNAGARPVLSRRRPRPCFAFALVPAEWVRPDETQGNGRRRPPSSQSTDRRNLATAGSTAGTTRFARHMNRPMEVRSA